jgi:mannosyltransferase
MGGLQREASVPADEARPGRAADAQASARWPADWLVAGIPALAELVVGGYRIGVPSLWRDEAATISGSQRSLSAIIAMLQNQDAVHGPYYVLMHAVIAAGGISATTLRLPSLIAMCLAAGLTAALGRRLAQSSGLPGAHAVGLLAGLALTAVPLTTRYAQEARPYALATLFVVLATYALVRAVASGRRTWWLLYAAAVLLAGMASLFAALIVVAHAASLWWARGSRDREGPEVTAPSRAGDPPDLPGVAGWRHWLAACLAAGILLAPMAYLSAGQTSQLSWVRRPDLSTMASLIRDFAGRTALIPVIAVLAVLGCAAASGLRRREGLTLAVITLPWLVLPPVLLIVVSFVQPFYVERYVLFCLPGLSLLSSAGLIWLAVLTRRAVAGRGLGPRRANLLAVLPSAALVLVIIAALIGPQAAIRQVSARADNLRGVSKVIAAHERPGDAILYLPQDAELVGVAYPAAFRPLRDIGLAEGPVASATLRGLPAAPQAIAARLNSVRRLWTVEWANPLSSSIAAPAGLTRLLAGLHLIDRWRIQSVVLSLYTRRSS